MMTDHFYAAIMAGGGGTRLWPLSRRRRPKQSLALFGDRSLFRMAVDRVLPIIPPERILILTVEDQMGLLREQAPEVPEANFILEPAPRGTASAIGLAAVHLMQRDPEAVMACLTADHYIGNTHRFREVLLAAHDAAMQGSLITLGITPSRPDPGYGYIRRGAPEAQHRGFQAFRVRSFQEKPSPETAEAYIASGEYSWNSGMFIWRAQAILDEIALQMPALHRGLGAIRAALGKDDEQEIIRQVWGGLETVTVDYGIMEGARDVLVIPADDLGWTDVGDWGRLFDILEKDPQGNLTIGGEGLIEGGSGNFIVLDVGDARKLVALLDVKDLVVVDTGDALLVCKRQKAHRVKELVGLLKRGGMDDLL